MTIFYAIVLCFALFAAVGVLIAALAAIGIGCWIYWLWRKDRRP
jgi:hypothetical protein